MSWKNQLRSDSVTWLCESESPHIRYLALRDLVDHPEDHQHEIMAACQEAHRLGPIATILDNMHPQGYWVKPGAGYNPKYRSAVWSIISLGQLGASIDMDERIGRACGYLLDHSLCVDGQFTTSKSPANTIDCLQGNLCAALMDLGCTDPRLDKAIEWMARTVSGEGLAPFGADLEENQNKTLRYYYANCGPLFACGYHHKQTCAWGAVKVMLAFSKVPIASRSPLIQRAIDLGAEYLLSSDPALAQYDPKQKPSSNWWKFAFPIFYITDLLQNVEALVNLGFGKDARLSAALDLIRNKQDDQGRWALEYTYSGKTWVEFGEKNQPNPWITLRALRILKRAAAG